MAGVYVTELDADGFPLRFGDASPATDDLWSQIRSLNLRAESRDTEAMKLNEDSEGDRKRMLGRESRELRDHAKTLTKLRTELISEKLGRDADLRAFSRFARLPPTEIGT